MIQYFTKIHLRDEIDEFFKLYSFDFILGDGFGEADNNLEFIVWGDGDGDGYGDGDWID